MSAITAKARRKMKKYAVLTREPRCFLGSFDFSWEQRKLGELVDRVVRKNTNNESTLPLTISAQYGLVDQITYFNNRVASRDVSNYYLVLNGEFAYNKSTSDGYPFGAVKRLDLYKKGVLSTLYIVFAPKKEQQIDSDYLTVFFDTDRWHKGVAERAAEGARNHGLLNISAEDFFDIDLSVPKDIVEQKQIGAFIRQLDNLITLHQRKCVFLFGFFQAFISMIFTASTFSWEQRKLTEFVEFFSGLTYTPNDVQENGTLVLRSSNVSNGEVVDADNVYVNPQVVNSENVKVGDIVVVVRNGSRSLIGKHAQIKAFMPNTVIGAFMTGIRSECPEFTNALLNTSRFEEEIAMNMGATINQITGYMFSKMEFKVPCLDEQKKIGEYFEKLDRLITLHQRECISFTARAGRLILTANKKRNTSSWEQRKLGDIGKARSGVGFPDAEQGGVTGIPFFKVSDMNLDGNENEMTVANNYVTAEQIAVHRWSPITELPAIFFAKVGAAVMLNRKRLCRFPFLLDNNTMAYSLGSTKWDADFAKALFGTVDLTSLVQVGALPSYNAGDVESMEIYLPSLLEQEQLGGFFKQLDTLITLHQRKPFLMKWRTSDANRNQTNRLVL